MFSEIRIDLHGLTEEQAYGPILNALNDLENNRFVESINFITGKGTGVMQMVLETTLEQEGYLWVQDHTNPGSYTVFKKGMDW